MELITGLNAAVTYIEQHITDEFDVEQIAKKAGCSVYHLQRMFAYLANVPLSEYIRRRRMSLAAAELQNDKKILDVAVKYGYESPTAFNRAFKKVHGIAPSAAKKKGSVLQSFPPITFNIAVTGGAPLAFRIEKKAAFRITGITVNLSNDLEANFAAVPKMWLKASLFGTVKKLATLQDNPDIPGILGVSVPGNSDTWQYWIAAATEKDAGGKFCATEIGAFTWAIFEGSGTGSDIQKLEKRIVCEWLPSSGYEYDNGPDVEVYLTPDPKNARFEVWIPICPKRD